MTRITEADAARGRRWLRGSTSVGESPWIKGRPTIMVEGGQLRIGDRFRLASVPVGSHLGAGPDATLEIGDDVTIGHGAAIVAFQQIRIGSGTQIGPFVVIMDTNYHAKSGSQSVEHDCRPVMIGRGCRIGSRVTITRGATIGDGAEILAGSVVASSIPAGACAAGARARVIGRAGDAAARWDSPCALLPDLLMAEFGLSAPPDLDDAAIPEHLWTPERVSALVQSIDRNLGVAVDSAAVRRVHTFSGIAALLAHAHGSSRGHADRTEAASGPGPGGDRQA